MMRSTLTQESAETLAFQALGWLAEDEDRFSRFLALSGLDVGTLRETADSRDTARAVLDFLLSDEALLLDFCEVAQIAPKMFPAYRSKLD